MKNFRKFQTYYGANRIDVQRLVLSSFIIMRFFAAAIHSPKIFALRHESPDSKTARTLALVSKLIQRLSNAVVSRTPLTCKEQWLAPAMNKFINSTQNREQLCQLLDRLSLTETTPESVSQTMDSSTLNILHEGFVVHRSSGKRRACPPFSAWRWSSSSSKRVRLLLTDTELIWCDDKEGEKTLGRVHLGQVTSVESSGNLSSMTSSDGSLQSLFHSKPGHVIAVAALYDSETPSTTYWLCGGRNEMNDWTTVIRRQLRKVQAAQHSQSTQNLQMTQTMSPSGSVPSDLMNERPATPASPRHSQSYDAIDIDRMVSCWTVALIFSFLYSQLEHIHYACIEHADTLRQWKDYLKGDCILPTVRAPPFYDTLTQEQKGVVVQSIDELQGHM